MDNWVAKAIRQINADAHRSADTHLFKLPLPRLAGVDIYLKDESTHPTGSLNIGLRGRFFCTLCAMAKSKLAQRLLRRLPAAQRFQKLTLHV